MNSRFGMLRREATGNVTTAPLRSIMLMATSILAGSILVLVSSVELGTISTRENSMTDDGIYIYRVQTALPVPATLCDRLRYNDGVQDSGALLSSRQGVIGNLPGTTVQQVTGTAGYLRIVWKDSTAGVAGSLVGAGIAKAYGFRSGTQLSFMEGDGHSTSIRIGLAASSTSRLAGANYLLATPSLPSGLSRECLVQAVPSAMEAVAAYLVTVFGPDAVIAPLSQPSESIDDLLHSRISLWTPLIIPLALALLAFVSQYGRRADVALYRLLGGSRVDLMLLAYLDASVTLLAPFSAGVSLTTLLISLDQPIDGLVATYLSGDITRAWLLLLLVPIPMAIGPARKTALAWLKGQ